MTTNPVENEMPDVIWASPNTYTYDDTYSDEFNGGWTKYIRADLASQPVSVPDFKAGFIAGINATEVTEDMDVTDGLSVPETDKAAALLAAIEYAERCGANYVLETGDAETIRAALQQPDVADLVGLCEEILLTLKKDSDTFYGYTERLDQALSNHRSKEMK